jgi:hypothetical protein
MILITLLQTKITTKGVNLFECIVFFLNTPNNKQSTQPSLFSVMVAEFGRKYAGMPFLTHLTFIDMLFKSLVFSNDKYVNILFQ